MVCQSGISYRKASFLLTEAQWIVKPLKDSAHKPTIKLGQNWTSSFCVYLWTPSQTFIRHFVRAHRARLRFTRYINYLLSSGGFRLRPGRPRPIPTWSTGNCGLPWEEVMYLSHFFLANSWPIPSQKTGAAPATCLLTYVWALLPVVLVAPGRLQRSIGRWSEVDEGEVDLLSRQNGDDPRRLWTAAASVRRQQTRQQPTVHGAFVRHVATPVAWRQHCTHEYSNN